MQSQANPEMLKSPHQTDLETKILISDLILKV